MISHAFGMGGRLLVNFELISNQNMVETPNLHRYVTAVVYSQDNEFWFRPHTSFP